MSEDQEQMRKQTISWLETVPRHKKNVKKMQMVFVDGKPKFIPIF